MTRTTRRTDSTRPTPAAVAKDFVHPHVASAAARGVAARIAPACPTMPVSWVMNGACLTRNQTATSRNSEVKTIASPAPSITRAAMPTANDPAKANQNCPADMSSKPTSMSRFDLYRSSSTPTGICIAA